MQLQILVGGLSLTTLAAVVPHRQDALNTRDTAAGVHAAAPRDIDAADFSLATLSASNPREILPPIPTEMEFHCPAHRDIQESEIYKCGRLPGGKNLEITVKQCEESCSCGYHVNGPYVSCFGAGFCNRDYIKRICHQKMGCECFVAPPLARRALDTADTFTPSNPYAAPLHDWEWPWLEEPLKLHCYSRQEEVEPKCHNCGSVRAGENKAITKKICKDHCNCSNVGFTKDVRCKEFDIFSPMELETICTEDLLCRCWRPVKRRGLNAADTSAASLTASNPDFKLPPWGPSWKDPLVIYCPSHNDFINSEFYKCGRVPGGKSDPVTSKICMDRCRCDYGDSYDIVCNGFNFCGPKDIKRICSNTMLCTCRAVISRRAFDTVGTLAMISSGLKDASTSGAPRNGVAGSSTAVARSNAVVDAPATNLGTFNIDAVVPPFQTPLDFYCPSDKGVHKHEFYRCGRVPGGKTQIVTGKRCMKECSCRYNSDYGVEIECNRINSCNEDYVAGICEVEMGFVCRTLLKRRALDAADTSAIMLEESNNAAVTSAVDIGPGPPSWGPPRSEGHYSFECSSTVLPVSERNSCGRAPGGQPAILSHAKCRDLCRCLDIGNVAHMECNELEFCEGSMVKSVCSEALKCGCVKVWARRVLGAADTAAAAKNAVAPSNADFVTPPPGNGPSSTD